MGWAGTRRHGPLGTAHAMGRAGPRDLVQSARLGRARQVGLLGLQLFGFGSCLGLCFKTHDIQVVFSF